MSWGATAPAAIVNLTAMISAALPAVEVRDGPALDDSDATEVITVGYVGVEDDTAVENESAPEGLGAIRDRENYSIHCAVATRSDEALGVAFNRARAFELLAAAGQVLVADKTLRGAVMNASIRSWSLRQDQATGGFMARLRFEVACDAFTNR
jgi:hypothetical protein